MSKTTELGKKLKESFDRWNYIYEHGGSDPFWEDGVNLNLERNHIISYKRQCEEELSVGEYPEEYITPTPPEVDNRYMARADEIRRHARESLVAYKADANYQYLRGAIGNITNDQKNQVHIGNVLNYVQGLADFIEEDSLVQMRRHERREMYLESFADCRRKIETLFFGTEEKEIKPGQISLFDLFGEVMSAR